MDYRDFIPEDEEVDDEKEESEEEIFIKQALADTFIFLAIDSQKMMGSPMHVTEDLFEMVGDVWDWFAQDDDQGEGSTEDEDPDPWDPNIDPPIDPIEDEMGDGMEDDHEF
jgi:hypothetical protein